MRPSQPHLISQGMSPQQLDTHGCPLPADSGGGAVSLLYRLLSSGWSPSSGTLLPRRGLAPGRLHNNGTAPQPCEPKLVGPGQPRVSSCCGDLPREGTEPPTEASSCLYCSEQDVMGGQTGASAASAPAQLISPLYLAPRELQGSRVTV